MRTFRTSGGGSTNSAFAHIPAALQGFYVSGFHQAFSIAVADSVWIGVGAAALSLVAILALKEKPLRAHFHADQAARSGLQGSTAGPAAGPTAGRAAGAAD